MLETKERLHSYFDKESNYPKADNHEDKRENGDPADKRYRELIQAKQTCLLLHLKKKLKKLKIEDIEQEYWKLIKTKAKPPSENKTIADLKGHRTSFNLYF